MRKAFLILGLVPVLAVALPAQSAAQQILEPPSEQLVAVHHPNIDDVEQAVRDQIRGLQKELSERAKPATQAGELSQAYANMARVYHAYSFFEPAKECYENASRLAPDDFRWIYLLGKIAEQQSKFEEAVEYFNKAIEKNPSFEAAHINLGDVYFELDQLESSEARYKKVLSHSAESPAALYGMGRIELARKNYFNAASYFSKVLELVPAANRVHYSLALAYRGLGEAEKAKFHIGKQGTVGIRPNDPLFDALSGNLQGVRLRLVNGKLAMQAKRYTEAEAEFRKALELDPENVSALVNLGAALTQLGKGTEAINQFGKALSIEPANVNARFNLAYLFFVKGDFYEAVRHYKYLVTEYPKDIESRFGLGKALHRANLLQEAASELVKVYQAQPGSESVLVELATVFTKIGEHKQARDLLVSSYQKDPKRGLTIAALSLLLASSPDKSLRDGEKALQLSQLLFKSTGQLEHGVTVALSLAELGRCDESEKMTRDIMEKAKAAGNNRLSSYLENALRRFIEGQPCRP